MRIVAAATSTVRASNGTVGRADSSSAALASQAPVVVEEWRRLTKALVYNHGLTPVLAERAHVAQRAQLSSVRRRSGETGARTLGEAVAAQLRAVNVDPSAVEWDVEADIDPGNRASARTLERLGFRREGLLRERWIVNGEISDSALYGLLRRDWYDLFPERS